MSDAAGADLIKRREAVLPRGIGMFPTRTTVASASGAILTDADGRKILDFATGIGVTALGHCHPKVVAAVAEQAATLMHACIHVSTYAPYLDLCETLVGLLPHGPSTKAMLINSGAEAVENAVKIARQATGRQALLCYEGAFHGRTLLGMTLTAKSAYKRGSGPFAPEVYRLPFPDFFHRRGSATLEQFVAQELQQLQERFSTGPIPAEHVAAIIIEPIQGEGGFIPAPPAYLQGLRSICDEHGILLICDEVQTGFGRTGRWAAYEHAGIVPDLSTWAKAMGGGLPVAAVVGRSAVMDAAEPGTLGGTYGGNPVSCAAALATIKVMQDEQLLQRAQALGTRMLTRFQEIAQQTTALADVRGLGAMLALEFCHDGDPRRPGRKMAAAVALRCVELGLLILTAGAFGNVVRLLIPLTVSDDELDRGLNILEQSIKEVCAV